MSKLIQQLEAIGQNAALRNQPLDQSLLSQHSASNKENCKAFLAVPEIDCQAILIIGE